MVNFKYATRSYHVRNGWMLKLTWTRNLSNLYNLCVLVCFHLWPNWPYLSQFTLTSDNSHPHKGPNLLLFSSNIHSGKWTTKKATFVDPITTWTIKINVPFLFYCFSLLYHYYSSKNDILPSNINDHSCFTMWQVWVNVRISMFCSFFICLSKHHHHHHS